MEQMLALTANGSALAVTIDYGALPVLVAADECSAAAAQSC